MPRPARQRFPRDFLWGVATSGYQIEGAPRAGGKGESIWDRFTHQPGTILHGDNGDIACRSHERRFLERDLDLLAELGVGAYIFSVQWPRIQPDGRGPARRQGLDYYRRLVDGLSRRGVRPALTLYHWELPQALQDRGGWLNRDTAARFADYAALMFDALGAEVPIWITQNEPATSAWLGYGSGKHAPGWKGGPASALIAAHHLLLSHGLAVQAMRATTAMAAATAAGRRPVIGPVLNVVPFGPADRGRDVDRKATRLQDGEQNRLFLEPILRGRYPRDLLVAHGGANRRFAFVREGDLAAIAAPVDFVGINYYRTERVAAGPHGRPVVHAGEGEKTAMGWAIDPRGLTRALRRVQRDYSDTLPLLVSENGASFRDQRGPDGECRDPERVAFIESHLRQAARAIAAGVPLKGWFVWSLLDNFEWDSGYRERFGLVHVDYASGERTPKSSFAAYRDIVAANAV